MPLMTKANYAKHRRESGLAGGSAPAVHYAIRDGRITVNPDGLIDAAQADREWVNNTNPASQASGVRAGAARAAQRKQQASPSLTPPEGASTNDYNKSRASKEFYESELARLKFAERDGSLIPATVVKKILYEAGRIIRTGHEDIVAQLAPDLSTELDLNAVERLLKRSLMDLDNALAERILDLENTLLTDESELEDEAA